MPKPSFRRAIAGLALAAAAAASACAQGPETSPEAHDPDHRIRALIGDGEEHVLATATGDTVRLSAAVAEFYRARNWDGVWTDENGFLERGKAMVGVLHAADAEGLDLSEYHRATLHDLIDRAQHDVGQDLPVGDILGTIDLLLTEAFLRYSSDLRRGTIDPSAADLDWRIPREDPTDAAFLNQLLEEDDLETVIQRLRPATPFYDRLRASLARYREIESTGGWDPVAEGETIKVGDRGERVLQVRRRLAAEGAPGEAALMEGAADPAVYDSAMVRAVEHFQRRHGIVPDGAVGAETRTAMNVPVDDRIRAIKLNLDRWRWLPQDLGEHFVMVNVAGQEMAVVKDGEPTLTMNVIIGDVANQTPIFQDTMEHVVVNPYWNVPQSIADEELWPKVERDPGYLARNDYEVVGSGNARRIRQKPGRANALGHVKFLFPNDMNIYLHDTPTDHLFSRSARAFSHGCIRLERPDDLARYLFTHATDRSADEYDALRARETEQWVNLTEKLPVYILYFTAWADDEGSTRFYPDVYERDSAMGTMAEKLDGTAPAATADPAVVAAAPPS